MNDLKKISNEELLQAYKIVKEYIEYLNIQRAKLEEENERKNTRAS